MKTKPTTGEWTAETVQSFVSYDYTLKWCAKVANAHNAALAAEREKQSGQPLPDAGKAWLDEVSKLQQQLAAEQDAKLEWAKSCQQLRSQVQTLVDALKESREIHEAMRPDLPLETLLRLSMKYQTVITAALAKVEDQPVQLPMINDDPVISLK